MFRMVGEGDDDDGGNDFYLACNRLAKLGARVSSSSSVDLTADVFCITVVLLE